MNQLRKEKKIQNDKWIFFLSNIVLHLREFLRLSHGAASRILNAVQSNGDGNTGILGDGKIRPTVPFQHLAGTILDSDNGQRR